MPSRSLLTCTAAAPAGGPAGSPGGANYGPRPRRDCAWKYNVIYLFVVQLRHSLTVLFLQENIFKIALSETRTPVTCWSADGVVP